MFRDRLAFRDPRLFVTKFKALVFKLTAARQGQHVRRLNLLLDFDRRRAVDDHLSLRVRIRACRGDLLFQLETALRLRPLRLIARRCRLHGRQQFFSAIPSYFEALGGGHFSNRWWRVWLAIDGRAGRNGQ